MDDFTFKFDEDAFRRGFNDILTLKPIREAINQHVERENRGSSGASERQSSATDRESVNVTKPADAR